MTGNAAPRVRGGPVPSALQSDELTHVELTHIEKKIEHWVRFGRLDYVGGFEIRADRREVGGLSGLVIGGGGRRFLALSDDGLMVKAPTSKFEMMYAQKLAEALGMQPRIGGVPMPLKRSDSSGSASACSIAAAMRVTIGAGRLAGPKIPYQD